jgi:hypothetical protein
MINSDYEILDELKQRLTNSELVEAISILNSELELSNKAIIEGLEELK